MISVTYVPGYGSKHILESKFRSLSPSLLLFVMIYDVKSVAKANCYVFFSLYLLSQ